MSDEELTVPEPDTQVKELQAQFIAMMEMMQANELRNQERHSEMQAEQLLLRDEVSNGGLLTTPKKLPVYLGRKSPASPSNVSRRKSQYYGNVDAVPIPKVLASGDAFTKMVKYGGKAHESIHEHFITFEYHARKQELCFWCDLLQLTFAKTIHTAIVAHGLTLRAGRNDSKDCPQGWYDYAELKDWLIKKYHRDQFQMELLARIFFNYNQTGTLDAYLSLIDTKVATCETKFSDALLKVLVLEKMDPATRSVMSTKPETYTQSYTEFCLRALLEYDTLQTVKKNTPGKVFKKPKYVSHADQSINSFTLVDKHTLKSGNRTFTSPWKPGNDRYKSQDKPPCNYCKETGHNMLGCAVLWLRYYGQLSESECPRPDFVSKYLETHDVEEIAALSCSESDEESEAFVDLLDSGTFISDQEFDYSRDSDISAANVAEVGSTDEKVSAITRSSTKLPSQELTVPVPPPPSEELPPEMESIENAGGNDSFAADDIYKVPNSCIAGHDSRTRMLLDCVIDGVPCKALLDTGSCVTGVSIDWFTRSGIKHAPSPVRPFACRSVTDHSVNTTEQLLDCPFSIDKFDSLENFALLPISKTYQAIIGKDSIRRMGMCLNFHPHAEHAVIIQNPPRTMASVPEINAILPDWSNDDDIIGNVFDLDIGGLTANSGNEFVAVSGKKFKKLRKHQEKQARKRLARAEKHSVSTGIPMSTSTLSITKCVCLALCMAATVAMGDSVEPGIAANYTDENFASCPDYEFAQDRDEFIAGTFAEPDDTDRGGFLDPYLKCPISVLNQINLLRKDCVDIFKTFKSKVYGCFSGMPHESKINRRHEKPMVIELKEEFKDKAPPLARTYKTPYHLLEILKKSLTEMLKAGWIRPSTSEYCAPVLVLVKPHQDIQNMDPKDVKYRIVVDLSSLNARIKTEHYRVPDVTSAWDKLAKSAYFSVIDLEKGFWQSKICKDDESISYTAFGCEFGQYEFVTAPMGLKNSPAHFQSEIEGMCRRHGLMDMGVLRITGPETISLVNGKPCVHTHIDDLIIFSKTKEEHLQDLDRVCTALSNEQYYCNRDKCYFFLQIRQICRWNCGQWVSSYGPG